jgi:transcriptional regulator with XRE-family HTH domain
VGKKTIYSEAYRHLVDRLRERRESLGHTQTALAKAIGWPQQKLSAVEIGSRRLDVMEYFTLTTALGLSRQAALNLVPEVPRGRTRESGATRGR